MTSVPRTRVEVLGCPLDILSADDLLRRIEAMLGGNGKPFAHLVTLNPEYVMLARRDPDFRMAIEQAELAIADGIGVVRAASLLHGMSTERVPGVEVMDAIVAMSGRLEAPVYLLGGGPGVAQRAIERLRGRHSRVCFAGHAGVWGSSPRDDEASVAAIAASGARVVLVAYGAPGQVTWIERNRARLADAGVRLAVGVGGAFDFHAGDVPRAPVVVQRAGLEWLYRLARQPWRWRRQLSLPVFAWLVWRERRSRG